MVGPTNYTTLDRTCQVFFYKKNAQKKLVGLPPVPAKVFQRVAVFNLFLNRVKELAIITAVAGSHIIGGFLPHMGTLGAIPFTHPNHPPHTVQGTGHSGQSGKWGNPRLHPASSSRSHRHSPYAFSPLFLSSLSF
jgi:hypothetical protein